MRWKNDRSFGTTICSRRLVPTFSGDLNDGPRRQTPTARLCPWQGATRPVDFSPAGLPKLSRNPKAAALENYELALTAPPRSPLLIAHFRFHADRPTKRNMSNACRPEHSHRGTLGRGP